MGKTKEQRRNWLQVLTDFVEQKMAPPLLRIAQIRYLEAMQNVFITMMPYMLLGAAATLILNLSGLFAEGSGLNMPVVASAIDAGNSWFECGIFYYGSYLDKYDYG